MSRDCDYVIRKGKPEDGQAIFDLYRHVYGDRYTLSVVIDPKERRAALRNPDFLWVVIERGKKLCGNVIYEFDRTQGLGKVFGAVIDPVHRGHDLMVEAMRAGLEYADEVGLPRDVIYATTRTVSPAPQRIVEKLGFRTLGIFPNVRKVQNYETHGLHVLYSHRAMVKRRRIPQLIPEVKEFFEIAREEVGMAGQVECNRVVLPLRDPRPIVFEVDEDEARVAKAYAAALRRGALRLSTFPFHAPHLHLYSEDDESEAYLHFNRVDAYGCILGLRTDREDLVGFLNALSEEARGLGMRYIEMLVDAYSPAMQRAAFEARFVPCAYFPAFQLDARTGERLDYLVFSRSFEQLDFTQIELLGTAQRFLEAFMKCWYWMLLRDEPDFSDQDRLF